MATAFVPPKPEDLDQMASPAPSIAKFTPPPPEALDKPDDRGFFTSLWDQVKSGPANLLGVGNSINQAVTHPMNAINAMGGQIADTGKKAAESFKQGNYGKAIRQGINTGLNAVVPGLGTQSEQAGQQFDQGNVAGGLGTTAGIGINTALGVKAPQIMRGAAEALPSYKLPSAVPEAISSVANKEAPSSLSALTRVDPRIAINRGLRPTPSDPNFSARVPDTLAAIRDANGGNAPTGITNGQLDLIPATQKAIEVYQGALEKWLARAKGVMVNGDEVVAATRNAIPKLMWTRDPQGAQALVSDAQRAFGGKQFPVEDFRDFLRTGNAADFYNKSPVAQQSAATGGTPPAIDAAQTGAIRNTLYKALDPEGNGAGPRRIQAITGDLYDMRDAALRRNNAIVAEQPLTPAGRVIDPMKSAIRTLLPGKATGAGIAYAEGSEGRSLPLIRRAFDAVEGNQTNAIPLPKGLYPTGDTGRLLGPGARQMGPATPDASSVRAVPAMTQPPNPQRALPPPSTTVLPMPGDVQPTGPFVPPNIGAGGPPQGIPPPVDWRNARNVPQYAFGGIIHKPTLLVDPLSHRITGTMAERGPEAITPLSGMKGPQVGQPKMSGALEGYFHRKKANPLAMSIGHIGKPQLNPPKYHNPKGLL